MQSTSGHVLILGLGASGFAAAETALVHRSQVTVIDGANTPPLRERAESLTVRGARVMLDWNDDAWHEPCDLAIVSPGIASDSQLGHLAAGLSCPVVSELEFGYSYCSCPIIAVTGTNGKTTTVELLTHCLNHAGLRVMPAGNIGRPLSEAARKSPALDFIVCEVSSFQLEHIDRFAPLAAAILNITPDHLDRHKTLAAYRAAKLRLLRHVAGSHRAVLRADLTSAPDVCNAFPCGNRAPITFSSDTEEATFFLSREGMLSERRPDGSAVALAPASELKLPGRHSVENALAVLALTRAAGIEPERVAPFVRTYAPSAHRIELIAYHDGVRYINDSKATNADALRQAVLTVMEKRQKPAILLIAGGVDKGLDFEELTPLLKATVKEIFLIGTCRHRLAKQWGDVVSCKVFASLEAAFESAAESACVGDVVMLSPGCASQDMFRNYAHRGDVFRSLVERRIGE